MRLSQIDGRTEKIGSDSSDNYMLLAAVSGTINEIMEYIINENYGTKLAGRFLCRIRWNIQKLFSIRPKIEEDSGFAISPTLLPPLFLSLLMQQE